MKDTLLNTFNPFLTAMICIILLAGSLVWTNKDSNKPYLSSKPLLKQNKFM